MNPKTDFFFNKAGQWEKPVRKLRSIILDCNLEEELKWGCPCYVHQKSNVVLIHHFKEYCALLFFKGALLGDPDKVLIQQTENVQAARQMRFTDLQQINALEEAIKAYVFEAIEIEKQGLKVELKKTKEFHVVDEFKVKLDKLPELKTAFENLTPGRQRAYLLHFSSAKQAKTREARIEKYIPQILDGKGIDD